MWITVQWTAERGSEEIGDGGEEDSERNVALTMVALGTCAATCAALAFAWVTIVTPEDKVVGTTQKTARPCTHDMGSVPSTTFAHPVPATSSARHNLPLGRDFVKTFLPLFFHFSPFKFLPFSPSFSLFPLLWENMADQVPKVQNWPRQKGGHTKDQHNGESQRLRSTGLRH